MTGLFWFCIATNFNRTGNMTMIWTFWKKKKIDGARLSKPRELESRIGRNLVVELNYDPDWVWQLRSVNSRRQEQKAVFDFRIFDPVLAKTKGIPVDNYLSLDAHPELIYFDGWYDKYTWEIELNDNYNKSSSSTAA